jgi:hypothetical protein
MLGAILRSDVPTGEHLLLLLEGYASEAETVIRSIGSALAGEIYDCYLGATIYAILI